MKKEVAPFTFVAETLLLLSRPGALLVSLGKNRRPNVMAIGWGMPGIIWRKPIFAVLVRPSRYTYSLLEDISQFTVNVPYPQMAAIVAHCGSVSGREHNKIEETRLTLEPARTVAVPIIRECGLHYECQIVGFSDVLPDKLTAEIKTSCYPQGDYHRCYYGEILRVSADENFLERLKQTNE
ncbi:MAG: flavin reductase family protein [Candidatus Omnitrophica bacterium]|nr:flavin reductase family protein [Candidatus Omnitrophota bacterium]MCM8768155.1 flavin reductase family protein [Candidatus Omnitrophota bacterium]